MAAANIALHVGAVPVFADIDPRTWCVTAATIEARLTSRTRAIVPVHTYGNVCAMDEIVELGRRRGVCVIEDAAEAFASKFQGKMAGTLGAMGTYSLHATKTITTGEGGMVVTADEEMWRQMLLYRSHGMGRTRYWHEVAGHNFRLPNMQAAMGCAQLEQIERISAARRRMFATYRRMLGEIQGVTTQYFSPDVDPVPWVVAVTLDPKAFPQGRDAVMNSMTEARIETRPGFYTPSRMHHLYKTTGPIPASDATSDWLVALPSFASISDEQIELICSQLARLRR